jgi:hypothetical protein
MSSQIGYLKKGYQEIESDKTSRGKEYHSQEIKEIPATSRGMICCKEGNKHFGNDIFELWQSYLIKRGQLYFLKHFSEIDSLMNLIL